VRTDATAEVEQENRVKIKLILSGAGGSHERNNTTPHIIAVVHDG